jgi:hypothetical protein
MHVELWWESQKERDNCEDIDLDGRIMLKWILERWVVWTGLIWLRIWTNGGLL